MSFPRWNTPMIMAMAAAALLLVAGVLMARYEDQLYIAQQTRDLSEQAQILAASVTAAIVFSDQKAAAEYVDAVKVNPSLQAAGVYEGNGKPMAGFARVGTLPAAAPQTGNSFAGETMSVAVPVTQGAQSVGTVYLRATSEPVQRRVARYAGLVLLVTMGALVIGVLSFSQLALSRRADELSHVNQRLHVEMAERQKTEEALRQSHKMEAVGQLSGGIAHDFNNLIMIAKGSLRLMRRKLGDPAQAETYIVSADEALDRAASLTQRILAFSRRQPLSPVSVSLTELVGGMGELLRHSVGEQVEVKSRLAAAWWCQCDVNQMENVILNLAINARDAMAGAGTLSIETEDRSLKTAPFEVNDFTPGDYVALVVRDTGEGMSESVRQRAVDPFFTTKPLGKGTGLGLSQTFGFVRQSNGYLVIESIPGKGTAITILMPRYSEGMS